MLAFLGNTTAFPALKNWLGQVGTLFLILVLKTVFSLVFISLAFALLEPLLEPAVHIFELNFPPRQGEQFRVHPAAGDTAIPFHLRG
jgi:hypothetical protein